MQSLQYTSGANICGGPIVCAGITMIQCDTLFTYYNLSSIPECAEIVENK